jgi:benzylsuccinate CoA-transferase BbsF subunit
LVKELIRSADMVLENLTVGALDDFGLSLEQMKLVNPSALVLSSQTMGRRGPWSHWRGYGSNTQLPSGMSWLWSLPDVDEPVPQNVAFPDHFVGRLGATTVAADLIAQRHGQARAGRVEIIQAEMALNLLADRYLQESLQPGSVRPLGNRSPLGAPWGVYQCAGNQRWVVITCRTPEHWRALVSAMGSPDWASGLEDVSARVAAQDLIDGHISAWAADRDDREAMALLQAHGVPAGYMMYISDQPQDPHFQERGYVLELDQPGLGDILLEGPAFHATRLPAPITTPAPLLGEHTMDIWTGVLGHSPEEAQPLIEQGILICTEVTA